MIEKLGGRKFTYALLITTLGFVLVCLDKVTATDFLTFVGVVGTTYVIGNVASKATVR
jgi:hypothetical protein